VSTPELEALLQQAIAQVEAGGLKQGRALLERVLEQDPRNDRAWVWLSGCVEEPLQRRICLQQALKANPNNQAALDGMDLLEGRLVPASQLPPSLLETRLSAIGMGDQAVGKTAPTAGPASPQVGPVTPVPPELAEEQMPEEAVQAPGRGRLVLLIAAVVLLFVVVCALVATTVLPALLEALL